MAFISQMLPLCLTDASKIELANLSYVLASINTNYSHRLRFTFPHTRSEVGITFSTNRAYNTSFVFAFIWIAAYELWRARCECFTSKCRNFLNAHRRFEHMSKKAARSFTICSECDFARRMGSINLSNVGNLKTWIHYGRIISHTWIRFDTY